jgi:ribosomal protein S6
VYLEVELDSLSVRPLENTILITEEVLRHLLVSQEDAKIRLKQKKTADKKADITAEKSATIEEGAS